MSPSPQLPSSPRLGVRSGPGTSRARPGHRRRLPAPLRWPRPHLRPAESLAGLGLAMQSSGPSAGTAQGRRRAPGPQTTRRSVPCSRGDAQVGEGLSVSKPLILQKTCRATFRSRSLGTRRPIYSGTSARATYLFRARAVPGCMLHLDSFEAPAGL